MNDEAALRDKLRKIEALFAGAATAGEKAAAGAAADGIRGRLRQEEKCEKVEMRFSLPDPWARHLFIALCRRYGLRPYRYPRMRQQSVMLRAPQSFLDKVLWPEFQEINAALAEYLAQVTDRVIREEVYKDAGDAEEMAEPRSSGDSAECLGWTDAPWPADLTRLGSRYEPPADHLRCDLDCRPGLLWPLLQKIGLGRLPGDIVIERENVRLADHQHCPLVNPVAVEAGQAGLQRPLWRLQLEAHLPQRAQQSVQFLHATYSGYLLVSQLSWLVR
jgi:hypothetical protein